MIITKTPFRMSFFGGGTDYPAWYRKEGGAVLSTTIDKYCYLSCRVLPPFFNLKHRIVWSHIEMVNAIKEILHPAIKACLEHFQFDDATGLEIHYQGDLPARAGMGSSSSFAVGLIKALKAMRGELIGKHELALEAINLEQNVMQDNVGSQDQVATAYGGLNVIYFNRNGEISVEPVVISTGKLEELESSLVLIYTGTSRLASEIAGSIINNLGDRRETLLTMRKMVDRALDILGGKKPIEDFGEMLHESWLLKRGLSPNVSSPEIDSLYQTARENGAIGGKLLGAGGSGFMLFFVAPEKQPAFVKALKGYLNVPFEFEHEGSTLIYYKPNQDALK